MPKAQNSPRNSQQKASERAKHSTAYRELSRLSSFALTALLVLLVASCRTTTTLQQTQQQAKTEKQDSVTVTTVTEKTWIQSVPPDTAQLLLPIDSIQALPQGAAFTTRRGRLTLTIARAAPRAISVTATTDSTPQTIATTTRTEQRQRQTLQQQQHNATNNNAVNTPYIRRNYAVTTTAIAAGVALAIIATIIRKKQL